MRHSGTDLLTKQDSSYHGSPNSSTSHELRTIIEKSGCVHRPQGMLEPGVHCSRVNIVHPRELAGSPEALRRKLGDDAHLQSFTRDSTPKTAVRLGRGRRRRPGLPMTLPPGIDETRR